MQILLNHSSFQFYEAFQNDLTKLNLSSVVTGANMGERVEVDIKTSSSNDMRTANSRDCPVLALPLLYHSGNNLSFKS